MTGLGFTLNQPAERLIKESRILSPTDLRHRYHEDAQFKALVDNFVAVMRQQQIQPYEVRDAAFIAELIYRESISYPLYMDSPIASVAAIAKVSK